MKRHMKVGIKLNKVINKSYYYIGSILMNLIKIFVKTDRKLILFVSFGGKQYNDSPKAIYEAMINDSRFKDYNIVWAFKEPNKVNMPGRALKVKIDSIKYFLITLKARIWVSNAPIERRLNYKGKKTFYFCTWHGTPIKKIGKEVSSSSPIIYEKSKYDVITAQGEFDVEIFSKSFNIEKESIVRTGLPRNDVLANSPENQVINIKRKLNISCDKKVILYCPTYRDWQGNNMDINIDFNKWYKKLGDDYIVLLRTHAKVSNTILKTDIPDDFLYDLSQYDELNDLMLISDLLITDYSSLVIDYSILEKPILCYTYDFEKYQNERGMYFDIRDYLLGGSITEDELLNLIKNFSISESIERVKELKSKFVQYYGNASRQSLDIIYETLQDNKF